MLTISGHTRYLGSIPGWLDPLEKGMKTHTCILAWRFPWTGEWAGHGVHWASKSQREFIDWSHTCKNVNSNYSRKSTEIGYKAPGMWCSIRDIWWSAPSSEAVSLLLMEAWIYLQLQSVISGVLKEQSFLGAYWWEKKEPRGNAKWSCHWPRQEIQFRGPLCLTFCDSMQCNMPGFLADYQLLELLKLMSIKFVMPSNHLILCCPLLLLPSFPPSIRVFQWVSSSHQVAKVLEFQFQHQSFQWTPRTDLL